MREAMAALSEISRGQCHNTLTMKNEPGSTAPSLLAKNLLWPLQQQHCNSIGIIVVTTATTLADNCSFIH